MDVTIVQRPQQLLNPLDYDMAAFVHAKMRQEGVKLMLGHSVAGFEADRNGVKVLLKGEAALKADLVILAIGVTPGYPHCQGSGPGAGRQGQHRGERPDGDL